MIEPMTMLRPDHREGEHTTAPRGCDVPRTRRNTSDSSPNRIVMSVPVMDSGKVAGPLLHWAPSAGQVAVRTPLGDAGTNRVANGWRRSDRHLDEPYLSVVDGTPIADPRSISQPLGPLGPSEQLASLGPYFDDTDHSAGAAFNLDGPTSEEVRRFLIDDARQCGPNGSTFATWPVPLGGVGVDR